MITWRLAVYVGIPGSGKTSQAWSDLRDLVRQSRRPALVIDSLGDDHFTGIPCAATVTEAVHYLWSEGRSCRWTPRHDDDVERMARALMSGRRVHVLLDESGMWLTARRGRDSDLSRLLRSYRESHADLTIQLTTQHLTGDVSQETMSCCPRLFVFRCSGPATLDELQRTYGLPRERVASLRVPRSPDLAPPYVVEPGGALDFLTWPT